MFHKTTGGLATDNENLVSYTFPKGAVIEVNDLKISLANLKVECFGGTLDTDTAEHFTKVAALVKTNKDVINAAIYICDNDISGEGYPGPDDFKKYGLTFMTNPEFKKYRDKILSEELPRHELKAMVTFFKRWAEDNRKILLDQIQAALKSKKEFPKKLSVIYDDRIHKHTSHIVLIFESKKRCTLQIDNTLSAAFYTFRDQALALCKEYNVNPDNCISSIAKHDPYTIELRRSVNDNKVFSAMQLDVPIIKLLTEDAYGHMKKIMQQLLSLTDIQVKILNSVYNQNATYECVPYSIQNKLDAIDDVAVKPTNEGSRNRGIRFRAQQAVLSYLMTGCRIIPRYNDMRAQYFQMDYTTQNWYPNFETVCKELDLRNPSLSKTTSQKSLPRYFIFHLQQSSERIEPANHFSEDFDVKINPRKNALLFNTNTNSFDETVIESESGKYLYKPTRRLG
jgi:predicted HicB family RNase H-like nuclease